MQISLGVCKMRSILHLDARYLLLMENPAHHSGDPGYKRSVTGM